MLFSVCHDFCDFLKIGSYSYGLYRTQTSLLKEHMWYVLHPLGAGGCRGWQMFAYTLVYQGEDMTELYRGFKHQGFYHDNWNKVILNNKKNSEGNCDYKARW